jgi:hypothetical protein
LTASEARRIEYVGATRIVRTRPKLPSTFPKRTPMRACGASPGPGRIRAWIAPSAP